MSSTPTTQIDGDVAIGRNATIGGKAIVRGSATVDHNLIVKGWLEAPNIKGPNKGLFKSPVRLREVYPKPHEGWCALVGDSLPALLYIAEGGEWVNTGKLAGNPSIDCDQYNEAMEILAERVQRGEETDAAHNEAISDLKEKSKHSFTRISELETDREQIITPRLDNLERKQLNLTQAIEMLWETDNAHDERFGDLEERVVGNETAIRRLNNDLGELQEPVLTGLPVIEAALKKMPFVELKGILDSKGELGGLEYSDSTAGLWYVKANKGFYVLLGAGDYVGPQEAVSTLFDATVAIGAAIYLCGREVYTLTESGLTRRAEAEAASFAPANNIALTVEDCKLRVLGSEPYIKRGFIPAIFRYCRWNNRLKNNKEGTSRWVRGSSLHYFGARCNCRLTPEGYVEYCRHKKPTLYTDLPEGSGTTVAIDFLNFDPDLFSGAGGYTHGAGNAVSADAEGYVFEYAFAFIMPDVPHYEAIKAHHCVSNIAPFGIVLGIDKYGEVDAFFSVTAPHRRSRHYRAEIREEIQE